MDRGELRRVVRTSRRAVWFDSPWRIAGAALSIAAGVLVVAVVCVVFVVPKVMGGASLTVLSGSMEPVLSPGDVVVVRGIEPEQVCSRVGIGDIVTFFPQPDDPELITHRVVAKTIGTFDDGTQCRLVTQGDANSSVDEPVSPVQVRGVFMYGIPKLGWVREWVGHNPVTVLIVVGVVVVASLVWGGLRPPRTRVIAYPGGSVPGSVPGSGPLAGTAPGPDLGSDLGSDRESVPVPAGAEYELRVRELAVREREVTVREAELGLSARPACESPGQAGDRSDTDAGQVPETVWGARPTPGAQPVLTGLPLQADVKDR